MKKHKYNARWHGPGLSTLANVSLAAVSDNRAITSAKCLGTRLGFPNTPFTLYRDNHLIYHGL
jgi:hypothetical protein